MLLRLRESAADLLNLMKARLTFPRSVKSEQVSEKRKVQLTGPEPRHQNNTDTHLKKIEALEKMVEETKEEMLRYKATTKIELIKVSEFLKDALEEFEKMDTDLEDAKEEIKTVSAEKMELEERLKNCQKADEDKKLREEVENQKIIITKLEKKNQETKKQLKFQGRIYF